MTLEVNLEQIHGVPVVSLAGRLIDVEAKKMVKRFEVLFRKKDERIIVDMSNTDFIDSHGLGTIVYYHTLFQKNNKKFYVLNNNENPNGYIARLFELTHLDRVLRIVTSFDEIFDEE